MQYCGFGQTISAKPQLDIPSILALYKTGYTIWGNRMVEKSDGGLCNHFHTIAIKGYTFHHEISPPYDFPKLCNQFCIGLIY